MHTSHNNNRQIKLHIPLYIISVIINSSLCSGLLCGGRGLLFSRWCGGCGISSWFGGLCLFHLRFVLLLRARLCGGGRRLFALGSRHINQVGHTFLLTPAGLHELTLPSLLHCPVGLLLQLVEYILTLLLSRQQHQQVGAHSTRRALHCRVLNLVHILRPLLFSQVLSLLRVLSDGLVIVIRSTKLGNQFCATIASFKHSILSGASSHQSLQQRDGRVQRKVIVFSSIHSGDVRSARSPLRLLIKQQGWLLGAWHTALSA
mmetsp:Transcript_11110/g.20576  ORF Transcript_11110/g.20576 Transcript_11110/m.20576 type:complete len:260 (-) Transcript_11110:1395-2174(-)